MVGAITKKDETDETSYKSTTSGASAIEINILTINNISVHIIY